MCSHAWPIKLILIEHKVVAVTVDKASDMDVAAKKIQILNDNNNSNSATAVVGTEA